MYYLISTTSKKYLASRNTLGEMHDFIIEMTNNHDIVSALEDLRCEIAKTI